MEFSHSETPGSKLASSSPGLIAGNHVLHRLIVPRHPSYALKYLTILCSLRTTLRPSKFCYTIVSTLNSIPHKDTMALSLSLWLNFILSYRCALFFLNLLQNCVGLSRMFFNTPYNPLPIFVVKLKDAVSTTPLEVALCEDIGDEPNATILSNLAYPLFISI